MRTVCSKNRWTGRSENISWQAEGTAPDTSVTVSYFDHLPGANPADFRQTVCRNNHLRPDVVEVDVLEMRSDDNTEMERPQVSVRTVLHRIALGVRTQGGGKQTNYQKQSVHRLNNGAMARIFYLTE